MITTHELVCAERWATTMASMREIKTVLWWGISTLFLTMIAIIAFLAKMALIPH